MEMSWPKFQACFQSTQVSLCRHQQSRLNDLNSDSSCRCRRHQRESSPVAWLYSLKKFVHNACRSVAPKCVFATILVLSPHGGLRAGTARFLCFSYDWPKVDEQGRELGGTIRKFAATPPLAFHTSPSAITST